MRTIKFRGKSIDSGEWLYGYLTPSPKPQIYLNAKYSISVSTEILHSVDRYIYEVETETVGQFTGLLDKNGKEIYEGDVIRITEYENKGMPLFDKENLEQFSLDELKGKITGEDLSVVAFDEGGFFTNDYWFHAFFGDMRKSNPIYELEVLNNIHDTPELLNTK